MSVSYLRNVYTIKHGQWTLWLGLSIVRIEPVPVPVSVHAFRCRYLSVLLSIPRSILCAKTVSKSSQSFIWHGFRHKTKKKKCPSLGLSRSGHPSSFILHGFRHKNIYTRCICNIMSPHFRQNTLYWIPNNSTFSLKSNRYRYFGTLKYRYSQSTGTGTQPYSRLDNARLKMIILPCCHIRM